MTCFRHFKEGGQNYLTEITEKNFKRVMVLEASKPRKHRNIKNKCWGIKHTITYWEKEKWETKSEQLNKRRKIHGGRPKQGSRLKTREQTSVKRELLDRFYLACAASKNNAYSSLPLKFYFQR